MLGFISALSAAVATMTLLMAVLLANVLSSTMAAEENKGKAALIGIDNSNTEASASINTDSNNGNGNGNGKNIMKSLIFSHDTIKFIDHKKVKSIDIYCSYGNNISFDVAMTYTIYNTVLIKKSTPNVYIKALKPIEDNQGVNACFLKSEENERK